MIRVLVADDQAMVRGALSALLALEEDLDVVAQVSSGDQVVQEARKSAAEICILDIQMPGMNGIEAAAALKSELPKVRSLIVTTFNRPGYLRRAMEAGASGYLVKDSPAEQLADAIRRVHAGLRVVDPQLAAESLVGGANPLTEREQQVLKLARNGASVATIASEVFLSPGSVRNLLSRAISKTEATNRVEASQTALERGWI